MLATAVRHLELGIVTALTVGLAIAAAASSHGARPTWRCGTTGLSAPAMPGPSPEPVRGRITETAAIACNAEGVTTVVFKGKVSSLDRDERVTFHFRFADLPSRYSVMTGANGEFEVRIPREELGILDLCTLPSSGQRPASFRDASMSIQYELSFVR